MTGHRRVGDGCYGLDCCRALARLIIVFSTFSSSYLLLSPSIFFQTSRGHRNIEKYALLYSTYRGREHECVDRQPFPKKFQSWVPAQHGKTSKINFKPPVSAQSCERKEAIGDLWSQIDLREELNYSKDIE
jgi:hypothetical protein